DRGALPAPDYGTAGTSRGPANVREEIICAAFAELLGVDRVGADDSFFELGGHSLLAVTLAERLRERGIPVAVRTLFEAPTAAALAAAADLAEVPVPPRAIHDGADRITPAMLPLVSLSQEQIDAIADKVPGGAANIADVYPLAPLQEGILFHHLMDAPDGKDAYVMPTVLRFDSRSRMEEFLAALRQVIARHDIFRTSIAWQGLPDPVQVVWCEADLPVTEVSVPVADVAARPMDLSRAPLLDVHFTPEPDSDQWLVLVRVHHLAVDHTALEVVLSEIALLLRGDEDRLPEPVPFRDFVAQARLGMARAEHERYFGELLGDVTEPTAAYGMLDVHADGSRAGEARVVVDEELAAGLRGVARSLGVSAATVWHVVWARVLAAISGRDDVVFGTVLFGRMNAGAGSDRVPGPFINTLPVRAAVSDHSVADAVAAMQAQLAGLLAHEHAPLALALQASGVVAPAPLFTTLLNYRHAGSNRQETGRLVGIEVLSGKERTNYPVTVSIDDMGSGFAATVLAMSPADPAQICDLLLTTAQALVAAPEAPLFRVRVRPPVAPEPACPVPSGTLLELIGAVVQRVPDAVAVSCGDAHITYVTLDEAASRLAGQLAAWGAGPESVVAVRMGRSAELVTTLLGVVKAGAAYLPVDPGLPAERVEYMLASAKASITLTGPELDGVPAEAIPSALADHP
ncbi:MAG TPA: condensation domain-containing protein, partial [Streptosporangiaceae bacterium]|nr:condensation domain-containing protein [Streptosporangiaceae bacterium]